MSRLKVAMVAPPWLAVPPKGYGGIEYVVDNLLNELAELDVDVTLYCVNGSLNPAGDTVVTYEDEQYKEIARPFYDIVTIPVTHQLEAFLDIQDRGFDIIHDHNGFIGPAIRAFAGSNLPPMLHTLHGPISTDETVKAGLPDNRPYFEAAGKFDGLYYNAISKAQIANAPATLKEKVMCIVYNSVNLADFPLVTKKDTYYCTLARFTPDKGQDVAAKLCAELNVPLKMAGIVGGITRLKELRQVLSDSASPYHKNPDVVYFGEQIMPTLDKPKIDYIGNVSGPAKLRFIGRAKALLFPIDWEEPFGMAVIEALACGTPVVAMRRGAMPEIIQHGYNGYLADTEEEFKYYMQQVHRIKPQDCRRSVEEKFSSRVMAESYMNCYRKITGAYTTAN